MASAATGTPTDVVEFLVGQHQQIKDLFAETLKADGAARKEPFIKLRRLLAVHETAEEEIVHPRAKRKLTNGKDVVTARLDEEHEAKKTLAQLEKLDVSSPEFVTELTKFRDAVVRHADQEEKQEFAKLQQELSSDELEKMGRAAKLAQAIAPTRPHAGVESQVANLMAGPFAAMLDRARDIITGKR
ncbi:hemerythrin [Mycobacterium kyorinense]|uniref:Hemerythrin n=1 Tax=Mycobacterium kyorinense TaxID=487514 RepID=A0A1A2Z5J7_9MYCO|nr:hemerythrin domain-containing protein [Mycobacterium kyorinense]OBI45545.1 hemerythrin [Mycobacterium kyorinense]